MGDENMEKVQKTHFLAFFFFFFSMDFFSRIQVTNRGLAEKLSQSHGHSRNLQHITLIEKKNLTQDTIQIEKKRR